MKTSDICPLRAGGQQTQVGLYQTDVCLFLKAICSFQMKVFSFVASGGLLMDKKTREPSLRGNTAPCWAMENIHMNVEIGFFFYFILFFYQE